MIRVIFVILAIFFLVSLCIFLTEVKKATVIEDDERPMLKELD